MGMFDELIFDYADSDLYPEVNREVDRYQTKSLDCSLETYYVVGNSLCKKDESVETLRDMALIKETKLVPIDFSGEIIFYGNRKEPSVVYMDDSRFGGYLQEADTWHEYSFVLNKGKIVHCSILKDETVEDVKERLSKSGSLVLDGDNPVVLEIRKREGRVV